MVMQEDEPSAPSLTVSHRHADRQSNTLRTRSKESSHLYNKYCDSDGIPPSVVARCMTIALSSKSILDKQQSINNLILIFLANLVCSQKGTKVHDRNRKIGIVRWLYAEV